MIEFFGKYWLFIYIGVLGGLIVALAMGPKPTQEEVALKFQERVQVIELEDGTRCVVIKGIYSDNGITCEWSK